MTKLVYGNQKMKVVLERAENIVGKAENAGNQHFILSDNFSTLSKTEIIVLATVNLLSVKALNLVKVKILPFGIELKGRSHLLTSVCLIVCIHL